MMVLVMNVPLFVLGWRYLGGRRFFIRTIFTVVLYSVLVDLGRLIIPTGPTQNPMLNALYGGVVGGLGMGDHVPGARHGGRLGHPGARAGPTARHPAFAKLSVHRRAGDLAGGRDLWMGTARCMPSSHSTSAAWQPRSSPRALASSARPSS